MSGKRGRPSEQTTWLQEKRGSSSHRRGRWSGSGRGSGIGGYEPAAQRSLPLISSVLDEAIAKDAKKKKKKKKEEEEEANAREPASQLSWSPPLVESFATVLCSDADQECKDLFRDFLKNFREKKRDKPIYYKIKLKIMKEYEAKELEVDFKHLLSEKKYLKLAIRICEDKNNRSHGWLQGVAQHFINEEFKDAHQERFRVSFLNEPSKVQPLASFELNDLARKIYPFGRKDRPVNHTTPVGRKVISCVMQHVLRTNEDGKTWNGGFESKDITIVTYSDGMMKAVIQKATLHDDDLAPPQCSLQEKIRDLQKMGNIMVPLYKDNGTLPVYFSTLQQELESMETAVLKTKLWYFVYLEFHLALVPAHAWETLVVDIYNAWKSLKHDKKCKTVMNGPVADPSRKWQIDFKYSPDYIVRNVYWYQNENVKDKFVNSRGGQLTYKRNLLLHVHDRFNDKDMDRFNDKDMDKEEMEYREEIQVFAASLLPELLPDLLKQLFEQNLLDDKMNEPWRKYCTLRDTPEKKR